MIIYIELYKKQSLNFTNTTIADIRKNNPEKEIIDLDNFSDQKLFNYALQLAEQQSAVHIITKAESSDISLGPVLPFLNKLLKSNIPTSLEVIGQHVMLEKFSKRFKQN